MVIIERKRLKFLGTIVARDEEDIIGPMIEHHLENGIKDILFTDNSSKDRTVEIASKYKEVREITVSDDMTHNQESHTTRMARLACKFSPDWIVHLDADEFWSGFESLDEHDQHEALWVPRVYIHPPIASEWKFSLKSQRYYIDLHGFAREYKVIHRPSPDIVVKHGNHHVEGLECGTANGVYRHHYPIRTYGQFERKVVQGANALKARGFVCERWEKWLAQWKEGKLRNSYDELSHAWLSMVRKKQVDERILEGLLTRCYGVQPEVSQQVFSDLKEAHLKPEIKSWMPGLKNTNWFNLPF